MKEKVLTLCRRLQKCTLDDLVSYLETDEDVIKTALLYLENEGVIKEENGQISYLETPSANWKIILRRKANGIY